MYLVSSRSGYSFVNRNFNFNYNYCILLSCYFKLTEFLSEQEKYDGFTKWIKLRVGSGAGIFFLRGNWREPFFGETQFPRDRIRISADYVVI